MRSRLEATFSPLEQPILHQDKAVTPVVLCYAAAHMARRSASSSPAPIDSPLDRLTSAVEGLAQSVLVLTDILDDIREDLSWVTRNYVPPQEPAMRVKSIPRNFHARNWSKRVTLTQTGSEDVGQRKDVTQVGEGLQVMIDELVTRLADPLGEIAQEQLNILLGVLEDARRELTKAVREGADGTVKPVTTKTGTNAASVPDVAARDLVTPSGGFLF